VQIEINDGLDAAELGQALVANRRLQIENILTPASAEAILAEITANQNWFLAYNENGQGVEAALAEVQRLPPQQQQALFAQINRSAGSGNFQYCFMQYAISSAIKRGENPGHPLHAFHEFCNGPVWLDFMKALTGTAGLTHADVFCTSYSSGHFLTEHDDIHESRQRVAAYVLNLSKDWKTDWGGHLAFFDERGDVEQAFLPRFNTLNVFLVPQAHAVQQVSTFAMGRRLSLTGWVYL
jgi:Rps23 Pro-64 3,4-dihydroxylase Tpa1-like proline 4-hydroxylase